jgi:hypothetical protein
VKTLQEAETLVGALPATSLPVALLPVQVQTRFVTREGKPQLLVRVYPDELHLDGHEPALTAAEVAWGRRAWRLAWPKNKDPEGERLAWSQLAERFGRRRAEWIARRLRPTNLKQRPVTPPVFPAPGARRDPDKVSPVRARRLPDRWVVMAYQGGQRVLLEVGSPIAKQLPVGPAFDDEPLPDVGPERIPLDAGMRWLVEFAVAEKVGMGIRIELPPELASPTFDTLLVFGIRTSLAAPAAANELEALLDAQRYTRGLAFVPPGTPTNNTTETSSGLSLGDRDAGAAFESVPASLKKGSDAAIAARLLGVNGPVLAGLEGAARTDDLDARQLQTALWAATGGYYLDQIMASPEGQPAAFTPEQLEQARRHFVDYVRGLGPLPTLRAGRQPYGLLPAMSLDLFAEATNRGRFVQTLRFLRGVWKDELSGVPRLVDGGQDALVELLRLEPSSTGYRLRLAMGDQFFAPMPVFSSALSSHLESHAVLLRRRLERAVPLGLVRQERYFEILPGDSAVDFRGPLVAPGEELPGAVLSPNYISFLRAASFDDLINQRLPDGTPPEARRALLYLLLRHSVLLAYSTTALRILVRKGRLPNQPYREPVLVDIVGGATPTPTLTLRRAATTDGTLGSTLHTLTAAQEPEAAVLEELRKSLAHLEKLPVEALARHLSGCLDLFSYRLDAWITSLATRRLDELRKATPRGLALGGFGWIQDLSPSPRTPVPTAPAGEDGAPLFAAREPGGFVHAPSMAQASAAAVLRSGYLAHSTADDAGALAIDQSSDRVRLAESLLDGIRQGQQLGALLGYRFERALHDRQLDRFIPGFRRVSWLAGVYGAEEQLAEAETLPSPRERIRAVQAAQRAIAAALRAVRERYELPPTAGRAEIEALAAAKVADGMALVRAFQGGGVPFDRLGEPVGNAQTALVAELAALEQALDALGDALTAEGVFQLVRGNPSRASASVDAVAHGEIPPPELQFPETPRPGLALTHRLAVVFSGPAPPVSAGVLREARRAAEPNLDAWLRQMVGDPKLVRARAEFLGPDDEVLLAVENVRLAPLGLSNLDAMYLGASTEPGQPSDLERLLEHHLRRAAPETVSADAILRLDYGRVPDTLPSELSLGEFLELNAAFRAAILGGRALDARDFVHATTETPTNVDTAELQGRADAALAALTQARDGLAAQLEQPALDDLRERLVDFVFLGIHEAVPVSARGAAAPEPLLAQARAIETEASRRIEAAKAAQDPRERLESVLGRGFRVLPLVRPPNAQDVGKALGASKALLGGDPLEALSWLQGVSRVRPGASRLSGALAYAGALGRKPALELRVAQLPFVAGERWVALKPEPGKAFPPGKISLVAHLPRPFRPAQPLAGLMLDEWTETVPEAEVTTGLAFNYDAPGARPPQAVLLAVAPPGAERWRLETLEQTLLETLELAQLRALDPQALGGDEVLRRALPALYVSANLAGEALSTDFSGATAGSGPRPPIFRPPVPPITRDRASG